MLRRVWCRVAANGDEKETCWTPQRLPGGTLRDGFPADFAGLYRRSNRSRVWCLAADARLLEEKTPKVSFVRKKGASPGSDGEIAQSLFSRAMGYSHPEVHISQFEGRIIKTEITKHYPPDTTACIFWLKNRRPDLWRDVHRLEHTGKDGTPIQVEHMSAAELRADMVKRGEMTPQGRLIPQWGLCCIVSINRLNRRIKMSEHHWDSNLSIKHTGWYSVRLPSALAT